jgi:predicted nucleic acid-binding protein
MKRLFIDSSVLYSAAYSSKGHSRDLLLMAVREEIILVVSQVVLIETRRNLEENGTELAILFDLLVETIPFEIVNPTQEEVIEAAKTVVPKDAPILAAARRAEIDLLVTLDRKHFLGKPELVDYINARIMTPGETVDFLQRKSV